MKVSVIGAGTMGSVHSEAYTKIPGVELAGIMDIRTNVASSLAKERGTTAYTSFSDLLQSENPDVVDVCVPTFLHRTYVEQAAGAGKHVICEKPLGRTLPDARAIIESCRANGVKLFVGQVVRFFPEYRAAYDVVQSEKLGQIGTAHAMRGGSFPNAWNDWYANVSQSGSLIVDLMIHDFDFLRWCFGDVDRVFAKSLLGRDFNRIDHAVASLRFKSGVIAHVEGTWAYPQGFKTSFEIAGQDGLLQYRSQEAAPIVTTLRSSKHAGGGVAVPESPTVKDPYLLELEHFIDCIHTNKSPIVTAEDAYKALEISLAALSSVQTGQPVRL